MTAFCMAAHLAQAQTTGTKVGSWDWGVKSPDHFYSQGWSAGPAPDFKGTHGTRSWSGTDTAFTGQGGWFSSSWDAAGGSWIPDISRSGPGFGSLTKMVKNYNVQWTGTGSIVPNDSTYTFGLKFNTASENGWKDYDLTTSYECYIVTHTNKTVALREGRFFGTVTTPGDNVKYDCYEYTGYWSSKTNGADGKFKQLYAWRQGNSWSGPVNVQAILKFWSEKSGTSFNVNTWYLATGISIAPETFGTSGSFRLDNIRIPDLNTLLPLKKAKAVAASRAPRVQRASTVSRS